MTLSRRSLLTRAGTAVVVGTTVGCLGFGPGGGYTLHASDLGSRLTGDPFLREEPVRVHAETRVDFDTETKRQYLEELFEDGTVTAAQWPLVPMRDWGEDTRPRATFVRRDGTYYEVTVEDQHRVDRERWVFAFERVEQSTDGATAASDPLAGLSEQDRRIAEAAFDAVYAGHDGFLGDPEFDELQTVQFHQDLSAADSDLVPTPPWEYVEYENETFRAVADQRTIAVPERTFAIEAVGDSRSALDEYVRETVPEARIDREGLSSDAREVLDAAVGEGDRRAYEEGFPLSDGLSTALGELGILAALDSIETEDERIAFRGVVASYDGAWYEFDLLVMS